MKNIKLVYMLRIKRKYTRDKIRYNALSTYAPKT